MSALLRTLLASLALALSASPAAAQQDVSATVTMSADRTALQVGDVFRLEVRAEVTGAASSQVELPELGAFDVLGRQVSTPVQFRFGFGSQTQLVQSTTVHLLTLRAREAGTFDLSPAAVVAPGGRRFESERLTIRVGGPADAIDPVVDPSVPPPLTADGAQFDAEGFIRTVVDDARPTVGQQVTVTVYLYSRQPLRGGLQITQEPTTEGFWVHDLLPPTRSLEGQRQNVRGIDFNVYVLRRLAAFPLRAGALTIGATGVSVTTGGIFDIFGRGSAPLSRVGVPLSLEAQALPAEGRPAGDVHVGSLELTATLDRAQVATGDAVELTVIARGEGQVRQVNLPSPAAPGLRVLQPEISDEVTSPRDVVGGSRTFRWLIVPERPGEARLGPFEVPIFDPRARTYSVARAPALTLTAAGNPTGAAEAPGEARPTGASDREITLGPIRTRAELARSPTLRVAGAPWLPYAFLVAPLIFAGALLVRTLRRGGDEAARANKTKAREAKRRLSAAATHASENAPAPFYAAIAQALKELLESKLERPVGSLTHAELRRVLAVRGLDPALADRVVDELEGCDFARFAAAGARPEEMQSCLTRSKAILDELERFTPRAEEA